MPHGHNLLLAIIVGAAAWALLEGGSQSEMFSPRGCLNGAIGVFLMGTVYFHSVWVGLGFAAVPLLFAAVALLGG